MGFWSTENIRSVLERDQSNFKHQNSTAAAVVPGQSLGTATTFVHFRRTMYEQSVRVLLYLYPYCYYTAAL